MSKKNLDKKIREEQEATAHVFQDFINTFQVASVASPKAFVRSGVLYADKNELKPAENQLYKPKPFIKNTVSLQNALECAKILKDSLPGSKKRNKDKPKSNLEELKEELKQRHSEKSERERLKEEISNSAPALSYFEGGDTKSTNLFVASLDPGISETYLTEQFGAFGPLASVKIMWPRGEEKFRNIDTNCGFVAFMSRKDAERALKNMKHRTDMRVGWGKSVDLPSHPVYVPPELLKLYLPPSSSGLPFNAQIKSNRHFDQTELESVLLNAQVKVTIPLNRKILHLVHRMVEYVAREGPLFEGMIMNNEISNPDYNFLFENKSPVHVYYRWKLFSILQGESTREWRMEPFRMFKGGSIWLPPIAPDFTSGMPEELIKDKDTRTVLSESQCERFIDIIRNLTLNRASIAEGMIFCINHTAAIDDVIDIIVESLSNVSTKLPSKIARFYLLFDVMSNCARQNIKINNNMLNKLKKVLEKLYECFITIKKECDKILFGSKVIKVLQQFGTICLVPTDLFENYESLFQEKCEGLDGTNSSSDEPLDGASLLKRSLKSSNQECVIPPKDEKIEKKIQPDYFVPSKWDSVDPEELETQSMSSTQIFYMQQEIAMEKISKNESCVKGEEEIRKSALKKRDYSPRDRKSRHKKRKSARDYSPSRRDREKRRNRSGSKH
ncbi:U2 snRNP-associated SURP motif-containing protein-like [Anthonomus grandis grandis]|uniref:U2 snRNP-associated SURP motif-containing protein-like n=1 Tax=Anthonomus grandis grandis TaxID=2921223 RepID=UPI002165E540|nr:U2 snRNP-associated SURP motif-containing protein-like [Anthonomus grandis grandis]XP_050302090.1 U2 snRNP-associated SURP motif-containing protein-like [Anthonomus grandis grandis]